MITLKSLGKKYKTDKVDGEHTYKNLSYCDIYENYFSGIRDKVTKFVEIGIKDGNSLRMWKEYFPNATIYGIDIDPRCKNFEEERIICLIGDQNCETFLNEVKNIIGEYDILLDDGSHITSHQIKSYSNCKYNGYYIIEDLRCSYDEWKGAPNYHDIRKSWPGMKYNREEDKLENFRKDFINFTEDKVKKLDFWNSDKMLAIHHYPMIIIFENFKL
jgi:hypothetical protein